MIHTPRDRAHWLELRKPVVTSTEVSALFGLSKYQTALELALLKTGQIDDNFQENERTKWGTRLESAIAHGMAQEFGVNVEHEPKFATLDECRLGASFDFAITGVNDAPCDDQRLRIMFGKYGNGLMEVKNVDRLIFMNEWTDTDAPAHIELQIQVQMMCYGARWGAITAMVGGNTAHVLVRELDDEVAASIISKIDDFWDDLSLGVMPPASYPEDAEVIRRLYNYAEPDKVFDAQTDTRVAELCAKYVQAGAAMKTAEDEKNTLRAELLQIIGDAERVLVPGYSFNAAMRAPTEVKAYMRAGYRDFRVTRKKESKK